jgi:hypothetical protein
VIATRFNKIANFLNGKMGHTMIWNRCLTPMEHRELWDREKWVYGLA